MDYVTAWTATRQVSLSFTISWSLLKLMSIESVMPSNHLILCHHLFLPSIFPRIRVFSNKLALCVRWPKYWSFSFSISPPCELGRFPLGLTGLISLCPRVFLLHHNSKASILGTQPSLWFNSHVHTFFESWKKHSFD